jgi:hypothetical protein
MSFASRLELPASIKKTRHGMDTREAEFMLQRAEDPFTMVRLQEYSARRFREVLTEFKTRDPVHYRKTVIHLLKYFIQANPWHSDSQRVDIGEAFRLFNLPNSPESTNFYTTSALLQLPPEFLGLNIEEPTYRYSKFDMANFLVTSVFDDSLHDLVPDDYLLEAVNSIVEKDGQTGAETLFTWLRVSTPLYTLNQPTPQGNEKKAFYFLPSTINRLNYVVARFIYENHLQLIPALMLKNMSISNFIALGKIFGLLKEGDWQTTQIYKTLGYYQKDARGLKPDEFAFQFKIDDPTFDAEKATDSLPLSQLKALNTQVGVYATHRNRLQTQDQPPPDISRDPQVQHLSAVVALLEEESLTDDSKAHQLKLRTARGELAEVTQAAQGARDVEQGRYQTLQLLEHAERRKTEKIVTELWPRYMKVDFDQFLTFLPVPKLERLIAELPKTYEDYLSRHPGVELIYPAAWALRHVMINALKLRPEEFPFLNKFEYVNFEIQQVFLLMDSLVLAIQKNDRIDEAQKRRFKAFFDVFSKAQRGVLMKVHDHQKLPPPLVMPDESWFEDYERAGAQFSNHFGNLNPEEGLFSLHDSRVGQVLNSRLKLLETIRKRVKKSTGIDAFRQPEAFDPSEIDPNLDVVSEWVEGLNWGWLLLVSFLRATTSFSPEHLAGGLVLGEAIIKILQIKFHKDRLSRVRYNDLFKETIEKLSINIGSVEQVIGVVPSQNFSPREAFSQAMAGWQRYAALSVLLFGGASILANMRGSVRVDPSRGIGVPQPDLGTGVREVSPTNAPEINFDQPTTEIWYEGDRPLSFAGGQLCYPTDETNQLVCSNAATIPELDLTHYNLIRTDSFESFRRELERVDLTTHVIQLKPGNSTFFETIDGTRVVYLIVQGETTPEVRINPLTGIYIQGDYQRIAVVSQVLDTFNGETKLGTEATRGLSPGYMNVITPEDVERFSNLEQLAPLRAEILQELTNQQDHIRDLPWQEILILMGLPYSERGWRTNREIIDLMIQRFRELGHEYGLSEFDEASAGSHGERVSALLNTELWDCEMVSYMYMIMSRWVQQEQYLGLTIYNRMGYMIPASQTYPGWAGNLSHMVGVYTEVDRQIYSYTFTLPGDDTYVDVFDAAVEIAENTPSYLEIEGALENEANQTDLERFVAKNRGELGAVLGVLTLSLGLYARKKGLRFKLPTFNRARRSSGVKMSTEKANLWWMTEDTGDNNFDSKGLKNTEPVVDVAPDQEAWESATQEVREVTRDQQLRQLTEFVTRTQGPALYRVTQVLLFLFNVDQSLYQKMSSDVYLNWDATINRTAEHLAKAMQSEELDDQAWLSEWATRSRSAHHLSSSIRQLLEASDDPNSVYIPDRIVLDERLEPERVAEQLEGRVTAIKHALETIMHRLNQEIEHLQQTELPVTTTAEPNFTQENSSDALAASLDNLQHNADEVTKRERHQQRLVDAYSVLSVYFETLSSMESPLNP